MNHQRFFLLWGLLAVVALLLNACAAGKPTPAATGEVLLGASHDSRPQWTVKTPASTGESHYFIGLSSESTASEQIARQEALDNARVQVVAYYSSIVKRNSERLNASFGLSSTVVDPTTAAKSYERVFAANVAKQVKEREIYWERWQKPTGVGYKLYMLTSVPKRIVQESLEQTAAQRIQQARDEARTSATQRAKEQAENVTEFWTKMKQQGLAE